MPVSTARSLPRSVPQGTRTSRFAGLVPFSAEEFFRRRLTELGGLGHLAIAVALIGALATYYAGDPSWDMALPPAWSRHTHNLLGLGGAYFADIFIQTLGLAAYLLPLAIAAWGALLLRHRQRVPLWRRLIILFPALLVSSATLALLKPFPAWPLATSLGGSVGQAILAESTKSIGSLIGRGGIWIAWPLIALLTVVMLSVTFGVRFADWRAAFGAVAGAMSWSSGRFGALRSRRRADDDDAPVAARAKAAARREPEVGGRVAAFAPAAKEQRKPPRITAGGKKAEAADPRQSMLNLPEPSDYMLPPQDLLQAAPPESRSPELNEGFLQNNAELLAGVLSDFGVKGDIVNIRPGPVVTLYELEPAPGTKSSRVIGLADDLARSMSALAVRVAVVPGRNVIGIELPNQKRETVYMREILENDNYQAGPIKLPLILGKDIGGLPVVADLARMPHLLVAGTTGSGKSVAINTMILSLLYRLPPERCRFIMVDPKMLELSVYEGIPHLLAPVMTDPRKAVVALKWTVREM